MDKMQMMEQFSNAYLQAIAATAGYNTYKPEPDDESVDWGIGVRGGGGTVRSPKIEIQLKCSHQNLPTNTSVAFPLKAKNYEDLRHSDYLVPRILVVVLVPPSPEDWLKQSEQSLALHHCGYWVSLRGKPASTNAANVTVQVPRNQVLSVEQLQRMMQRVAQGGLP